MENQIVCPNCGRIIANNSMIDDVVKGEGSDTQSMNCECGERITYWNMSAQLRDIPELGPVSHAQQGLTLASLSAAG